MRWGRFFEDLEDQLASEREAERAALESEAERLRFSHIELKERLVALSVAQHPDGSSVSIEVDDATIFTGVLVAIGRDWIAVGEGEHAGGVTVVPMASIALIGGSRGAVSGSARAPGSSRPASLTERMSLGFVLRDAARRRTPVTIRVRTGRTLTGTLDRAAADHADLAVHDRGVPRRSSEVSGHRIIPFEAMSWIRLEAPLGIAGI